MIDKTGGCLCGNIRYVVQGEFIAVAICHCSDCQRQSGSIFSVIAAAPVSAYQQTGATKTFVGHGDSGSVVYRDFCGTCGTPILSRLAAQPGIVLVKVGTLDDPTSLPPQVEAYTHRAADWLPPLTEVRFPKAPDGLSV